MKKKQNFQKTNPRKERFQEIYIVTRISKVT
jgi:hypothetical protein